MKTFDIAILGATGAVGQSMLEILVEREFPVKRLYPLASARSAGNTVQFRGQALPVEEVEKFDFGKVQIALFSAGGSVSAQYAPIAAKAGCMVIDNTSHFRYEKDIPLIIPEVNPQAIQNAKNRNIIANPNCSTIQMLVALKPIYDAVGISRINVATYQSVSGTGQKAINELRLQSEAFLRGKSLAPEVYPIPIAFNIIPHIDAFEANGYTREEMKMVWETRKILQDDDIVVNPTAVRVPVFYGHSEAIHIETKQKLSAIDAKALLEKAPGIVVKDFAEAKGYPSPLVDAAGKNPVFVGRIREDISHPLGLNLWVVSDNIRKGAALNSVQIAELLIRDW
ncbi:MAG: aspartate-semialdehyde dehydrogenase [Candidatus Berkiellales bacterium]